MPFRQHRTNADTRSVRPREGTRRPRSLLSLVAIALTALLACSLTVVASATPALAGSYFTVTRTLYGHSVTFYLRSEIKFPDEGSFVIDICSAGVVKADAGGSCISASGNVTTTTMAMSITLLEGGTINGERVNKGDALNLDGDNSTYNPPAPTNYTVWEEKSVRNTELSFQYGVTGAGGRFIHLTMPANARWGGGGLEERYIYQRDVSATAWTNAMAIMDNIRDAWQQDQYINYNGGFGFAMAAVCGGVGLFRGITESQGSGIVAYAGCVAAVFFFGNNILAASTAREGFIFKAAQYYDNDFENRYPGDEL